MAWDDNNIDNPDAAPYGQRKRGVKTGTSRQRTATFIERYKELLDIGETDDERIAKRLEITTKSPNDMRYRHGLSRSGHERAS